MNIDFIEHYQKKYNKKLNDLFSERIKLISVYPEIGRKTNDSNIRVTPVKDYLIMYEFNLTEIIIHLIWDSRRDESKMHK
ncbi:type II toxin-antitoxin system RelE/ParE family toxin [Flavobacterium sp. I3-2]|uniref:type II toxin-antitoxin system RelE/ParE family toxin n=1 Tax=Flavobacterium sp. I3-2 TaxID=2748319 RepID=UPI0015B096DD|nr:type II toxin-antitoxin system RelE/ParE family toxin [Flavobacterium sp. I3-2]